MQTPQRANPRYNVEPQYPVPALSRVVAQSVSADFVLVKSNGPNVDIGLWAEGR
jgi:hypothetical protein